MGGRGAKSAGKHLTNAKNSGIIKQESNSEKYKRNYAAISKALKAAESEKTTLNYEVGTVVDLNGNILESKHGEAHSVSPSVDLLKGNIFTHNHPSGLTFSSNDIQSFVAHGLHEVRASTPQGTYFSLKVASDNPNPQIARDYAKAISQVNARKAARDDLMSGKISNNDFVKTVLNYQSKFGDEFLTKHAKDYGYEYSKGDILK